MFNQVECTRMYSAWFALCNCSSHVKDQNIAIDVICDLAAILPMDSWTISKHQSDTLESAFLLIHRSMFMVANQWYMFMIAIQWSISAKFVPFKWSVISINHPSSKLNTVVILSIKIKVNCLLSFHWNSKEPTMFWFLLWVKPQLNPRQGGLDSCFLCIVEYFTEMLVFVCMHLSAFALRKDKYKQQSASGSAVYWAQAELNGYDSTLDSLCDLLKN